MADEYIGETWTVQGVTVDDFSAAQKLARSEPSELHEIVSVLRADPNINPSSVVDSIVATKEPQT